MDWFVGFLVGVGAVSIVVYVIGFFVRPRKNNLTDKQGEK